MTGMRGREVRAPGIPALVAFTVATVLIVAAPPMAIAEPGDLHPGDPVRADGQCTLGYVFDSPETTYFSVAGHCVELGDRPTAGDGTTIGRVAYDDDVVDVALIEVADGVEPSVDPTVRGHPDTPTGVADPARLQTGDELRVSGQGLGIPLSFAREQRAGVLEQVEPTWYCADLPAVFGDSGGPVLHKPTGEAVGLVNRVGGPCRTTGITVSGIVARARADGFEISLRGA